MGELIIINEASELETAVSRLNNLCKRESITITSTPGRMKSELVNKNGVWLFSSRGHGNLVITNTGEEYTIGLGEQNPEHASQFHMPLRGNKWERSTWEDQKYIYKGLRIKSAPIDNGTYLRIYSTLNQREK